MERHRQEVLHPGLHCRGRTKHGAQEPGSPRCVIAQKRRCPISTSINLIPCRFGLRASGGLGRVAGDGQTRVLPADASDRSREISSLRRPENGQSQRHRADQLHRIVSCQRSRLGDRRGPGSTPPTTARPTPGRDHAGIGADQGGDTAWQGQLRFGSSRRGIHSHPRHRASPPMMAAACQRTSSTNLPGSTDG